jgi:hypothetical protein
MLGIVAFMGHGKDLCGILTQWRLTGLPGLMAERG